LLLISTIPMLNGIDIQRRSAYLQIQRQGFESGRRSGCGRTRGTTLPCSTCGAPARSLQTGLPFGLFKGQICLF